MTATHRRAGRGRLFRLAGYARPHWKLLAAGTAMGAAVAGCQLAMPWIVRVLIDEALIGRRAHLLPRLCLLLAACALGIFSFQFLQRIAFTVLSGRVLEEIQNHLARHLQTLPLRYRQDRQSGQIVSLFLGDAAALSRIYEQVASEAFVNALTFAVSLALIVGLYGRLAWAALAAAPIYLLTMLPFGARVRQAARAVQETAAQTLARVQESVDARRDVQAFNREQHDCVRLRESFARVLGPRLRLTLLQAASSMSFVAFWSLLAALYWMGGRAQLDDWMSLGLLGALITYTMFLRDPFARAAGIYNDWQAALGSGERIFEFLETPPAPVQAAAGALTPSRGGLSFENVWFAYDGQIPALRSVSFTIEPGQTVAIVGPSGSGKSTLVSLALRLFERGQGCIRIDGIDISKVNPESVREQIGVVFQDPFLFSGSVRDNILFGDPEAGAHAIAQAAEAAHAAEFIEALPDGYDTVIGDRGVKLSGGQKQRLAVARAVLRDPPILILDEATSALDADTEAAVLDDIFRRRRSRTTIAVAHRFSAVIGADKIVVLDRGCVADAGTHTELLTRCPLYRQLYMLQHAVERGAAARVRAAAAAD